MNIKKIRTVLSLAGRHSFLALTIAAAPLVAAEKPATRFDATELNPTQLDASLGVNPKIVDNAALTLAGYDNPTHLPGLTPARVERGIVVSPRPEFELGAASASEVEAIQRARQAQAKGDSNAGWKTTRSAHKPPRTHGSDYTRLVMERQAAKRQLDDTNAAHDERMFSEAKSISFVNSAYPSEEPGVVVATVAPEGVRDMPQVAALQREKRHYGPIDAEVVIDPQNTDSATPDIYAAMSAMAHSQKNSNYDATTATTADGSRVFWTKPISEKDWSDQINQGDTAGRHTEASSVSIRRSGESNRDLQVSDDAARSRRGIKFKWRRSRDNQVEAADTEKIAAMSPGKIEKAETDNYAVNFSEIVTTKSIDIPLPAGTSITRQAAYTDRVIADQIQDLAEDKKRESVRANEVRESGIAAMAGQGSWRSVDRGVSPQVDPNSAIDSRGYSKPITAKSVDLPVPQPIPTGTPKASTSQDEWYLPANF